MADLWACAAGVSVGEGHQGAARVAMPPGLRVQSYEVWFEAGIE